MAGGVFTSQNKIRPGAYIKFQGVPSSDNIIGSRGTVAMALPLGWGPEQELIKVTVDDLYSNGLEKIIGRSIYAKESKLIKAALENAHTLLLYRGDEGGAKAKATISCGGEVNLEVEAKYAGTVGNTISISIKEGSGNYIVSTFLGSTQKDSQTVANINELKNNDFVTFSGEGEITEEAVNTLLTSGTDGTFEASKYSQFLALLKQTQFDTLAAYDFSTELPHFTGDDIKTFIQEMREKKGIRCQAVINDYVGANYEAIISTKGQGVKYADGTELNGKEFVVWVAGATAGADVTESNTYKIVTNAVEIVSDVLEDEIEDLITQGYLLISKRRDGAIVIEKDINTLVTMRDDTTEEFKENKVIRLLDAIANHIALDFEQNYVGKVTNDENGRDLFKTSIISYLTNLQISGAIINFDSQVDVTVTAGEQPDAFYSEIYVQPTYSVDKLYMVINVR